MRMPAARLAALALVIAACGDSPAAIGDPPLPGVTNLDPVLVARLAAATAARREPPHPFTNRLAFETSPYLLQHSHNPVSWYAWGDEPFERARREHKLVLVSVGYSTCHWCHVMEAESFEDEEVAAYMNANFICIKVDREERPDLDAVYMSALLAMKGTGGWPMNVVTDAERRPVFGASYMSKVQLLGVMRQLRGLLDTDPARLDDTARQLVAAMARDDARPAGVPGPEAIEAGARSLARAFDADAGGFGGGGTKFPSPPDLELLLRYHRRTSDPDALAMVTFTLDRIAAGGIHDHLAGGFHRYATDRQWLVPHFEKMLYDNAQLAVVYLEAAQSSGDLELAAIARTTLDYVLREMTSPEGGFYSATDADSRDPDGRLAEGRFFTWTPAEIEDVLGAETGALVRAWYAVGGTAAVDGRSVLHTPRTLADAAATLNVTPAELGATLEAARARLYDARAKRTPPSRDDKILTAWNGLMISALAKGGFAFKHDAYLLAAARAADLVLARLRAPDGSLLRSWRAGEARQPGTLEDYAFFGAGLLDLFEATWDRKWLEAALALAHQLDERFGDPAGGYFMTAAGGEQLLVRSKPTDDGVQPSANAVAIDLMLRLADLTGDAAWRARADKAFAAFSGILAAQHRTPALDGALDRALDTPLEVVIVAPHDLAEAEPLLAEVRSAYLPDRSLVVTTTAQLPALLTLIPNLDGKAALNGQPTAFVCERTACKQPTSVPAELAAQLAKVKPLFPDRSSRPLREPTISGPAISGPPRGAVTGAP